jgi:cystathionine gamma-synthase
MENCMAVSDLMQKPIWRAEELAQPIPSSPHAVSFALPRWQDVVGYEEKSPEVTARMRTGYPRFVVHPLVQELGQRFSKEQPCLPFPSRGTAELCAEYIRGATGESAQVAELSGVYGVLTSANGQPALKAFWQHTGRIICSRQAEAILEGRKDLPEAAEIRRSLRRQLAGFYDCGEEDVFLAPSGMAAQYAALRAVLQRTPGRSTAQLGFSYVDTFKIQEKFGRGGVMLHNLETIGADLHAVIHNMPLAACFSEVPGNPLLGSPDLRQVTPLLREHGVPLIADDVVATPYNVDLSGHADLIATSLTKFILGTGNAMGGALICNPKSPFYEELKGIVRGQHEELLWGEEALVFDTQARGFPERMKWHNENGLFIAEQFRRHPAIERVWYPKWEFSEPYEAVRRPQGGYSSLFTFLPKNAETASPRIYDRMEVCKGPSLGTVFTLACPFTLLAHYTELDWAESCGLSRYLIRISVGLEDPQELWSRLKRALEYSPIAPASRN